MVTSSDHSITISVSDDPSAHEFAEWDALVDSEPHSDVTQLSSWARLRATVGYDAVHVFARRNGRMVGGAQILARRIPIVGAAGYVAHGPVVAAGVADPDEVGDELAAACARWARKARILVVQPSPGAGDLGDHLLRRGFRPSAAEIAPAMTLRLDMTAGEEELRAGLNRRLRTWTGRWEARGVSVRSGTEEDAGLLARLMAQSAEYQRYQPFSIDYIRTMYRELAPGGHAELLVGEADGNPVAASLFTVCGGTVRFRLTGFDRSSDASRLKVPAAIMWEGFRRARSRGHHTFDLGGLSAEATARFRDTGTLDLATLRGPDFFKAGFGGTPLVYPPPVELIASRAARAAYDRVRQWERGRELVERLNRHMRGRPSTANGTR